MPKKSIKPTFPPTWEKTTTENRFKSLSYLSDEQITQEDHAASLDIQMQNIKLQRQVQFLQKELLNLGPVMTTQNRSLKIQKNVLSLLSLQKIIRQLKERMR